jgi:F-type H+-transporting ATPase subunit b
MDLVTPGIGLVFWMLLSFSIVLFLLKKFAWKPILEMLKKREDSIERALTEANEARKEMDKLKADNEKILSEARAERDTILKEARELKDKIVNDAKDQAGKEANKIINDARNEIQHQKAEAMNEIKNLVADLSVDIAEKILRKEFADKKNQEEFVQSVLKEINLN